MNTSLKNHKLKNISCFPNPVSQGFFFIRTQDDEKKRVEISNEIGQTILSDEFQSETKVNINNYPSGIYMLRISDKKGIYSQKIIKI